jgi:hypothetical protein
MTEQELRLHNGVKIWNIISSIFFIALVTFLYLVFVSIQGINYQISFFDIAVLILANYRLVRLFIYDNITLFFRELFMDLENAEGKYAYVNSNNSFKLTMHKLLNCPWCFGVWTTFISAFFYFTFPQLQIIFILLAISSVATFLIILSNLIGWSAEEKKLKVQKM